MSVTVLSRYAVAAIPTHYLPHFSTFSARINNIIETERKKTELLGEKNSKSSEAKDH